MATLQIIIVQNGKKQKEVLTAVSDSINLEYMKKLWGAEQTLNNILGANHRVHINIVG